MSRADKRAMIDPSHKHLSVVQQCGLLGLGRSSFYYQPVQDNAVDLVLMAAIDRAFSRALERVGAKRRAARAAQSLEAQPQEPVSPVDNDLADQG